eukprot:SAG25_NODE_4_length_30349_cov_110.018280_5_plen_104_part_00
MVASRVTLTLRTLVAAASLGPYCVSSHDSSLSCEQMVVDAYMTVLARQPLTAGKRVHSAWLITLGPATHGCVLSLPPPPPWYSGRPLAGWLFWCGCTQSSRTM